MNKWMNGVNGFAYIFNNSILFVLWLYKTHVSLKLIRNRPFIKRYYDYEYMYSFFHSCLVNKMLLKFYYSCTSHSNSVAFIPRSEVYVSCRQNWFRINHQTVVFKLAACLVNKDHFLFPRLRAFANKHRLATRNLNQHFDFKSFKRKNYN